MLSPSLHRQPYALNEIPTKAGVGYVKGDQQKARECYIVASKQRRKEKMKMYAVERDGIDREVELDPREGTNKQQAMLGGDLEEVQIDDNHPDRIVKIGAQLPPQIRDDLTNFLLENAQVFAWSYEDMLGIDPEIISHHLSINPVFKPIRQKCRAYDVEWYAPMKEKVDKLTKIGFVREVNYLSWLANVVMVRKTPVKWQMCVDFIDLNKVCPKDSFPLPCIDQLIDSTAGHELFSFMDAYSGYNQILM